MAVSLMIGLSIVRVNPWAAKLPGVGIVVNILHIFVLPILVVAMVAYTLGLTLSPDQSFADVRDALRQLLRK
jgi:hypothetical protein